MPTLSSFPMTRSLVALRTSICLTLAVLLVSTSGRSRTNGLVSIGVDRTDYVNLGDSVTVAVRLLDCSSQFSMGQIHLLLSFYGPALSITSVSPGNLLTNCGYEYFSHQHFPGENPTPYSTGLLRIDAAADVVYNPNHPSCCGGSAAGTLVELKFAASPDSQFACLNIPLELCWIDCDNNVIISATGDTTYYADRVYSA